MHGQLQPAARLRRDQVLAFVIEHIVRHGVSPTQLEIAKALNISTARVKELLDQLIKHGRISRVPGSVRNLRVVDVSDSRRQVDDALRRLGWQVADPMDPFPNGQLPRVPRLGHRPKDESGKA